MTYCLLKNWSIVYWQVIGVVMAVNKSRPGTCVGSFFSEQDEKVSICQKKKMANILPFNYLKFNNIEHMYCFHQ